MSLTNNVAVRSISGSEGKKLFIVRGGILPASTQTAIVRATEGYLTSDKAGLKEVSSGDTTTIFNNSTIYSSAFTVKQLEKDDDKRTQITHSPLDIVLIEKFLSDRDSRQSHWPQGLDNVRENAVAYLDLDGSNELANKLLEDARRQKTTELKVAIEQAGLNPGRIDIDFISEGMTVVPSRRGPETESIDSMMQEFSDTAVDFTETDYDYREQEKRNRIQGIDYFKNDEDRDSLLEEINKRLFDNDTVRIENVVNSYTPSLRSKGAYIEIKGANNSKIRIEREPNSEITKLVYYIGERIPPIEISGIAGLKELMSKIEDKVFSKLRELQGQKNLEFVSDKVYRSLLTIDPIGKSTNLELEELKKLLVS